MFFNVVFGIGRLLRRLLIVGIVALAAYVSAGRQFMPAVADYTQFVEEKVFELTGLPVNIASLTGSFSGFNPTIQVSGFKPARDRSSDWHGNRVGRLGVR